MHVYGVDVGSAEGDMTCYARYWVGLDGVLHVEEVTFEEVYERPAIEAHLVPGTNPPRYET